MTIELTVSSAVAGDLELKFSINQPIHAVKRKALAALKLDPQMATKYVLIHEGTILPEDSTLGALSIGDGALLLLEPKQPEVI